jgi:hypothetical protein
MLMVMHMKTKPVPVFCVIAVAACLPLLDAAGAFIKVVTEYRYPTSYTVTPITATAAGGAGTAQIVGGVVEPGDFETREVGSIMVVEATAVDLSLVRNTAPSREQQHVHGNTALMLAAASGDLGKTRVLLSRGVDVDARNRYGSTALMGASAGGFQDVVNTLLRRGAFVNSISRSGSTALMFAARNGHANVVRMLLAAGALVSVADESGKSALMHAVEGGHTAIVQHLVKAGADVNRRDRAGTSPLTLAATRNDRSMLILLTRLGARQ